MKVALTGSTGMLGTAVKQVFTGMDLIELSEDRLDITVLDKVVRTVSEIRPSVLIHAAAFTDVDGCEAEPDKAYLVNGMGTRNIAIACEEVKCPVFYISTDYVFDGAKSSGYDEWDEPAPINQYGLSKLMGERFLSMYASRFSIIRTSWLYGNNGKNFVDTITRLLDERDELQVVDDQVGSPTYTVDLARILRELTGKGYGIYHVSNSGCCSWYEFASEIAARKGMAGKITPVSSDVYVRPAKRPAFSILNKTMLRLEGIEGPRHWRDALSEYMKYKI